ncbi:LicD family protein [Candidatus Saccharibacteria bacterium]|nr:LicD family protein [Candidatus Saccharibacteria bacterium]
MKKISMQERRKILLNMLAYIDNLCRSNGIKYSLIGGSLIGAVRHNGFIPWDDDIDIILMPKDYERLLKIIDKGGKYSLLKPNQKGYNYPFKKLVDKKTVILGDRSGGDGYGVFIDILSYHYVSNNALARRWEFFRQMTYKKLLGFCTTDTGKIAGMSSFRKAIIYVCKKVFSVKWVLRRYIRCCQKNKATNYIVSNWPIYGFKKETQNAKSLNHYMDGNFEGQKVMICSDYDDVLRTSFGDYMELPPVEKRKSTHIGVAYWRSK